MDAQNAIAKVRFSSARPQRVQLFAGEGIQAEVLCLEPGQRMKIRAGEWVYYVVTGRAGLAADGRDEELSLGHAASVGPDEAHTLANHAESRLICLAVGTVP